MEINNFIDMVSNEDNNTIDKTAKFLLKDNIR